MPSLTLREWVRESDGTVVQALVGSLRKEDGSVFGLVFFAHRELTEKHPKRKWRAEWRTVLEATKFLMDHHPSSGWSLRGTATISVWDAEMNTFLNKGAGRATAAVRHRLQTARVNAGLPRNPVGVS